MNNWSVSYENYNNTYTWLAQDIQTKKYCLYNENESNNLNQEKSYMLSKISWILDFVDSSEEINNYMQEASLSLLNWVQKQVLKISNDYNTLKDNYSEEGINFLINNNHIKDQIKERIDDNIKLDNLENSDKLDFWNLYMTNFPLFIWYLKYKYWFEYCYYNTIFINNEVFVFEWEYTNSEDFTERVMLIQEKWKNIEIIEKIWSEDFSSLNNLIEIDWWIAWFIKLKKNNKKYLFTKKYWKKIDLLDSSERYHELIFSDIWLVWINSNKEQKSFSLFIKNNLHDIIAINEVNWTKIELLYGLLKIDWWIAGTIKLEWIKYLFTFDWNSIEVIDNIEWTLQNSTKLINFENYEWVDLVTRFNWWITWRFQIDEKDYLFIKKNWENLEILENIGHIDDIVWFNWWIAFTVLDDYNDTTKSLYIKEDWKEVKKIENVNWNKISSCRNIANINWKLLTEIYNWIPNIVIFNEYWIEEVISEINGDKSIWSFDCFYKIVWWFKSSFHNTKDDENYDFVKIWDQDPFIFWLDKIPTRKKNLD